MWEGLVRAPRGRISPRKFITLFATLLVACFAYLNAVVPTANAIGHDANWNGDSLSYDARDYTGPKTAEKNDKSTLPEGTVYYAAYDNGNARTGAQAQGYIIYFDKGTDPAKATSAYYVFGFFDVASGKFSNLSPPEKIDVDASTYGNAATIEPSSCDVSGIGWIICPVSNWIAEGMDYLYNIIASYLNVSPITGKDSGLYEMWDVVRNIANVCFIIGFLILIYAQITGGVISNYTIKKMLPRIIIAAILVNVSYWICAIAVDVSNILGASVQNMFMAMQERIGAANSGADDIGWVKVTSLALGGGSLATIGILGATAGGAGAFAFAIIGALIPALFAVFVAVIILAARQALITVMIVLAPLAFVAYLLPNTEEWFKRWRKLFTALMVMFPAFAVIFGGAQLTGVLIIQNASTLPVVILGLLVQVIPLFITPFLIRLSSGLMGTIAGMANDRSKGVFDRAKNWAGENRDMHKARALRNGMERRKDLSLKKGDRLRTARALARPTTAGAYFASGKMHRDNMTKSYNAQADAYYGRTRRGRKAATEDRFASDYQATTNHLNDESFQNRIVGLQNTRDKRFARHEHELHRSHAAHRNAEAIKTSIESDGEKHYQQSIANAATGSYEAKIKELRIKTVVDSGLAENAKKIVDSQGALQLEETILASNALRTQSKMIQEYEGRAAQAKALIEDEGKSHWEELSLNDRTIYSRQLERQANAKRLKGLQDEWESILAEASAGRTDDYQRRHGPMTQHVAEQIEVIREADQTIAVEAKRKANAEYVFKSALNKQLKTDDALLERAAGIDTDYGRTKVVADLYKEGSSLWMQNVEAVESTFSNEGYEADELIKVYQTGMLRDNKPATEMHVHAAIRQLATEKANNTAMQKMSDYMATQGMVSENGQYFDISDTAHANPLDEDEIERRRNLQQIYADAMNKTGHQVTHLSGTDKAALQTGTYTAGTTTAILRDIAAGKIKADRVGKMDIDEMVRSLQIFRDNPTELNNINASNRQAYVDVIDEAMNDPIIGAKLELRHRRALEAMKLYLNPTTPTPSTAQVNSVAGRTIPTSYNPLTLAD